MLTQKPWLDVSFLAQLSKRSYAVADQIGNSKASHEVKG
jgi:hypothetical protein